MESRRSSLPVKRSTPFRREILIQLAAASFLLVGGCTSTYTRDPVAQPSAQLKRGEKVAIATPKDGIYGDEAYPGSGRSTAQAVRAAFGRVASQTEVVDCTDLACLRNAVGDAMYFVVPEILHWEDRATEWSGKKDKLEVKLSIFGAGDSRPLASTVISGKSKWMTFGGDHPQDLLAAPVEAYVDSLF